MEVILIAAMTTRGVIGSNNRLPWHLPEDMAHFKKTTMGHTVIMGRKTYQSIGAPLPGRRNIVVTSSPLLKVPTDCRTAPSLQKALGLCTDVDRVFIIGGERLFSEGLAYADTLILTHIDADLPGDVFFPPFSAEDFCPVRTQQIDAALPMAITLYRRYTPAAPVVPTKNSPLS